MSAPDDPLRSAHAAADRLTDTLTVQLRETLAAAQRSATQLRRDVEEEATRRAAEIRLAAEKDAARVRREAEARATGYLREAHERVDAFTQGRVARLSQLTDELLTSAQDVRTRLDEVGDVAERLRNLIDTLGVVAEVAARETHDAALTLPSIEEGTFGSASPRSAAGRG